MNASANAAGGRLRQGAAEISPAKTDLRMGAQPEGARKELRLFEVMMILLLFLQKQNLAFAVYQFGSVLSLPD